MVKSKEVGDTVVRLLLLALLSLAEMRLVSNAPSQTRNSWT
jgi:hypothetical protein